MTTTFHQLPTDVLDRLATGGGGPPAIARLQAAQVSKHLLLIAHLLDHWAGPVAERDQVAALLDRARSADPAAFRQVIGAPLVGGWAAIAARAVERGGATPADFQHLGAIAVVACGAAGVDGSAAVPVHDGVAVLPGLGAAVPAESATASVCAGRLTVGEVAVPADPRDATGQWQPVRMLGSGRLRVELDDVHPYRHGHHVAPAPRVGPDEIALWRDVFDRAWELLEEHARQRADELVAGLRTLVPLIQTDPHSARSATIRHAFGVFGLTRPASAADFAVTLVHEFQHSKLSGLLDLVPLTDPADAGRYFAPWRTDPRPLSGLLQGVYAFAGVADTWQALRGADGVAARAEARFAEARLQVDRGLSAIEASGALTPAGETVAARLRTTTDALLAEPVPAPVRHAAEQALDRTRKAWIDRNGPV